MNTNNNIIEISTPVLKKYIDRSVYYTANWRLRSKWTIEQIVRRQVDFWDRNFIPFDKITSIELIND